MRRARRSTSPASSSGVTWAPTTKSQSPRVNVHSTSLSPRGPSAAYRTAGWDPIRSVETDATTRHPASSRFRAVSCDALQASPRSRTRPRHTTAKLLPPGPSITRRSTRAPSAVRVGSTSDRLGARSRSPGRPPDGGTVIGWISALPYAYRRRALRRATRMRTPDRCIRAASRRSGIPVSSADAGRRLTSANGMVRAR